MSETESIPSAARLSDLPRLPRDEGGPVFAEPWQAQAFALAVKLSEQGHFTWKEWAAGLAEELQAAAKRGEPDDGSRYYEHWLAALERLVTAKGLTDQNALLTRREAWAEAYRATPHGTPVELASRKPDARWVLLGVASTFAGYWLIHQSNIAAPGESSAWTIGAGGTTAIPQVGFVASAALGSLLGMQHAFEPDHLAAVATLMTGERTSAKAAWLGACWGLGHTLTLLAAGAALVVFRAEMPVQATMAFELGVGTDAGRIRRPCDLPWLPVGPCLVARILTRSHRRRASLTSIGGRSHDHCWWAPYTDWREAAHSRRS